MATAKGNTSAVTTARSREDHVQVSIQLVEQVDKGDQDQHIQVVRMVPHMLEDRPFRGVTAATRHGEATCEYAPCVITGHCSDCPRYSLRVTMKAILVRMKQVVGRRCGYHTLGPPQVVRVSVTVCGALRTNLCSARERRTTPQRTKAILGDDSMSHGPKPAASRKTARAGTIPTSVPCRNHPFPCIQLLVHTMAMSSVLRSAARVGPSVTARPAYMFARFMSASALPKVFLDIR